MIRMVAAARETVVAVMLVAGLPVLLVAVGGSPLPEHTPSGAQAQAWLDDPLAPQYVPGTARAVAWLIWALLAALIVAVWLVRVRRWRWARLAVYLPGPVQGLAATLLGAATVTTAIGVPPAHAAAPATAADATASGHINPAPAGTSAAATTTDHHADRPAKAPPTVTVRRGDTLWDIADDRLGDPHRWTQIYRLNITRHPGMRGGDHIEAGWTLRLPTGSVPGRRPPRSGSVTPATPPDVGPAMPPTPRHTETTVPTATAGQTATPATPSTGTTSSPEVSPAADQAGTAASLSPRPTVTLHGPGSSSPVAGTERGDDRVDGVDLPGGWIALGFGGGLLAAAVTVWRRRRHHYKPTPITSPKLEDADLLPPLAAMTRLRTSMRRACPDTLTEQPAAAPTVRQYRAAAVKPELPPVGPSGADLAGATAPLVSNGLGLIGAGALDAARGLLVATLASGGDDDPDAKGRVIIPATTLSALLGVPADNLDSLDRMTVASSHADAITRLEEQIIRRARLIADAQAANVEELRHHDVHAEPLPQLLLITDCPDPAWTNRLVTAVKLGHSVDIGAVCIGDWPSGTTLTVAVDGTTGTRRLSVLDAPTAIDMLGLLREAHGDGSTMDAPPTPRSADRTVSGPADDREPDHTDHAAPDTPAVAADGGRLPVAVRVLGRPAVLDADGRPSPGIRSKAIELLVYLAVNRHGADLSDIMEALFPDANLRRASERLSTVVADLRKHIRRAAGAPTDTTAALRQRLEPVPNTGSHYHLDPAVVSVDWWTVLDQYEAVAATTDTGRQLAHLTAALTAAGGGLAEHLEYDWVDTDREVVRRHRLKLHVHAAALLADTDPHRSWLLLEQACHIDPLSDELARTTMRAAATLGDADAIRHRRKTLGEALDAHGLELADDTEVLARELLRQLQPAPTTV